MERVIAVKAPHKPKLPPSLEEFHVRFIIRRKREHSVNLLRTVCAWIAIFVLITAIAAVALPYLFNVQLRAVLTGSMEPELPVGALVLIVPAAYEEIALGDDITYVRNNNGTVVTHRVVEKNVQAQTVTTQGLTNNTADPPVPYENVLGKVRGHIPFVGRSFIFLSTTYGKIISIGIIIMLLLLSVASNQKEKEQREQKISLYYPTDYAR
jgi:signal peptidase I